MAEQQVIELRAKLQNFQIQFDNYKIECKQLQKFLEDEACKKQDEIRILKEDAIKREKQLQLSKSQVSNLKSEINNLKGQLKQLAEKEQQKPQNVPPIPQIDAESVATLKNEFEESNKRIKFLLSQKQQLQTQIQQYLTRHSQEILELKQQIKQKDHKIKQILQELEVAQSQLNRDKKNRTVEIKIEKTKQVPIPQQFSYLKEMCISKENELGVAKQKISKLMEKLVIYEKRIIQLENQVRLNQASSREYEEKERTERFAKDDNRNHIKIYNYNKNQSSDEEQISAPKPNVSKPLLSVLFLTKQYYRSPFLDIEVKNTIKLFKTDKNGRIDKSLGSTIYKFNTISFNQEQIITKTLENIYDDLKNGEKSRIVIFGIKKSNKTAIMCQIINRLKSYIVNELSSASESQTRNIGVRYVEAQEDFIVKSQLYADQKQDIIEIINNIAILEKEKQENLKSSKRSQKLDNMNHEKKVRYFHYFFNQSSFEIITTNFIDPDVKQNLGLANALNKIAYSKIPHFEDQKCHIQVIVTLNPIVGLYEQCKQTLKLANCKKKILSTSNIYDWRQSPAKKILLANSRNYDRIEQQNEVQSDKVFKLTQKIEFYRSKLSELMLKLKIILSTHAQASYLKKSQAVLNYQKILKFVQSLLNQGYIESSSPRKQFKTVNLQDLQSSP